MLLICMEETLWEERKTKETWGKRDIKENGFIHSTKPEDFWRIVPYFEEENKQLVVIVIDENKLLAEVKEEVSDDGILYPHIYGCVNNSAVVDVQSFEKARENYEN